MIQYLTAYCRGVVIQLERNASDFFEGGVLHKPSDTMKDIMKSTPTNNIHCERPFAVYDRKSRVHENADPFTLCAITGAVVNQTFKQLQELPKSVQNWILKTAFYNQAKDHKEVKKNLFRIRQLADKAHLKKQKKGIKKLAVKMEKWLTSEKTKYVSSVSKIDNMYDALSDKQFIETAKQQMNYLMSHRGVSKKDLFV